MTAAALGSRLSLAGTVLGAAFASIIAAVAGALYTASLRRTSRGVSTVIARVRPTAHARRRRQPGQATAATRRSATSDRATPASTPPTAGRVTADQTRRRRGRRPGPDRPRPAGPAIGWKQVVDRRAADVRRRRAGADGHRAGDRSRPLRRERHDRRPGRRPGHPAPPDADHPAQRVADAERRPRARTASAAPSATAAPSSTPSSEPIGRADPVEQPRPVGHPDRPRRPPRRRAAGRRSAPGRDPGILSGRLRYDRRFEPERAMRRRPMRSGR